MSIEKSTTAPTTLWAHTAGWKLRTGTQQIAVLQGQLKQAFGTKSRLERQMNTLDINDAHYDSKILELQHRYDEQYDTIEEIEVQIDDCKDKYAESCRRRFPLTISIACC